MAFIDADEFLVPKRAATIPEALAHLGEARNVSLPWHMFGRSGHVEPPAGGVLRNYLRRARDPMSEVRGVRAFKVPGRSLPPDRATGAFDGDRRQRADGATTGARRRTRRSGSGRASIRRTTCSSTTTTPARRRSWRRRSGGGRTSRRSRRSMRARCAGRWRTSRPTRLKTGRRSTIWRGSAGSHADRADRLDLREPAGADALPDLGGAADGAAGLDLHRRRRVGAGDEGGDRGLRGGASGAAACGMSGTRTAGSRRRRS